MTLVLILPPILDSWPVRRDALNFNLFQILIVLPFYFGLAAAPGYIYAWAGHYNSWSLGKWVRRWVYLSLVVAVVSSLVGGILSILTVIVAPFAFWSFFMALQLLRQFREEVQERKG